jgi:hypothetical protein
MRQLEVKADPVSLLRNITKFFSNNHAFIQEMYQNARRAGATQVQVGITEEKTVIYDNGHGVYSPEKLLTIGGSEWKSELAEEMPAGMGLFSCFQISNVVTVRSADWLLELNYKAMKQGKMPNLEEGLDIIKGTYITLEHTGSPGIATLLNTFVRQGLYMPYSIQFFMNPELVSEIGPVSNNLEQTSIDYVREKEDIQTLIGYDIFSKARDSVEVLTLSPYRMVTVEEIKMTGESIIPFQYGTLHFKLERTPIKDRFISIITQGVKIDHGSLIKGLKCTAYLDVGCVDLRLPDRENLILTERTVKVLDAVKKEMRTLLADTINNTNDKELYRAASIAYAFNDFDYTDIEDDKVPLVYRSLDMNSSSKFDAISITDIRKKNLDIWAIPNLKDKNELFNQLEKLFFTCVPCNNTNMAKIEQLAEKHEINVYSLCKLNLRYEKRCPSLAENIYVIDSIEMVENYEEDISDTVEIPNNTVSLVYTPYDMQHACPWLLFEESIDDDYEAVWIHNYPSEKPSYPEMCFSTENEFTKSNMQRFHASFEVDTFLIESNSITHILDSIKAFVDREYPEHKDFEIRDTNIHVNHKNYDVTLLEGVLAIEKRENEWVTLKFRAPENTNEAEIIL